MICTEIPFSAKVRAMVHPDSPAPTIRTFILEDIEYYVLGFRHQLMSYDLRLRSPLRVAHIANVQEFHVNRVILQINDILLLSTCIALTS